MPLQRSLDLRHVAATRRRNAAHSGETDVDAQVVGERGGRHNGRIALIIRGSGGGAIADGPSLRPTWRPGNLASVSTP